MAMELVKLICYSLTLFWRLPPLARLIVALAFAAQSVYFSLLTFRFATFWYGKLLRRRNRPRRARYLAHLPNHDQKTVVGLFHPYCNAGGGGERVLWTAVAFHQRQHPDVVCAVYTGDVGVSKEDMVLRVKQRFDISLQLDSLILVPLTSRYLLESSTWPRFTLIGQSLGSIVVGFEALNRLIPDVYIDTMGYAFTFPLFDLLAGIPIGAYVHYPTISTDMLSRVSDRQSAHNHSSRISNSFILTYAKLLYYMIFAELYAACLRRADHLMVNSSWTKAHIDKLLRPHFYSSDQDYRPATTVYPPCDVRSFIDLPLHPRQPIILSISQFRPEKDQSKQIEAFAKFVESNPQSPFKLVLAGSCRDREDEERVESLKKLAKEKDVNDKVEFKVNVRWEELKELLGMSLVGISTMVDEHFGISIVEFMAAGLVPLVHSSGGPLTDIVTSNTTGYFATNADAYTQQLQQIISTDPSELTALRERARKVSIEKFSVEVFERDWGNVWERLRQEKRGVVEGLDRDWVPRSRLLGNEQKKKAE